MSTYPSHEKQLFAIAVLISVFRYVNKSAKLHPFHKTNLKEKINYSFFSTLL